MKKASYPCIPTMSITYVKILNYRRILCLQGLQWLLNLGLVQITFTIAFFNA